MLETREAKQTSDTVAELRPDKLYCILHEQMVHVEYGNCVGHKIEITTEEGTEIEFCCFEGGYALVPPPNQDGDWAADPEGIEDEVSGVFE